MFVKGINNVPFIIRADKIEDFLNKKKIKLNGIKF